MVMLRKCLCALALMLLLPTVDALEATNVVQLAAKIRSYELGGKIPAVGCANGCLARIPIREITGRQSFLDVGRKGGGYVDVDLFAVQNERGGVEHLVVSGDARYYEVFRDFILRALGRPAVSGERMVLAKHVRKMDEWLGQGTSVLLYAPLGRPEFILHLGR